MISHKVEPYRSTIILFDQVQNSKRSSAGFFIMSSAHVALDLVWMPFEHVPPIVLRPEDVTPGTGGSLTQHTASPPSL